jgi:hypothetical protein
LADTIQDFASGDMLIMMGDVNHAGCAWHSDIPNVRLFCYLPSAFFLPIWESVVEDHQKRLKPMPGLIHVPDDESLKFLTSPKHPKFLQDAFDSHLYCSSTDKFVY